MYFMQYANIVFVGIKEQTYKFAPTFDIKIVLQYKYWPTCFL